MTLARRLILGLGYSLTLNYATSFYVPSVMNQAVSEDLGVSTTVLLGGFTLALLIQAMVLPAVGRRIDRLGGRSVLAMSPPFTAVGLVLLAISHGAVLWYAGWVLIGLGMAAGTLDSAFGAIGRQLGSEARPVIVGITMLAGRFGSGRTAFCTSPYTRLRTPVRWPPRQLPPAHSPPRSSR